MITENTNTKYFLLLFLRISVSNQRSVLNVIYSPAITEPGKNPAMLFTVEQNEAIAGWV
jgi:hypothetical protein